MVVLVVKRDEVFVRKVENDTFKIRGEINKIAGIKKYDPETGRVSIVRQKIDPIGYTDRGETIYSTGDFREDNFYEFVTVGKKKRRFFARPENVSDKEIIFSYVTADQLVNYFAGMGDEEEKAIPQVANLIDAIRVAKSVIKNTKFSEESVKATLTKIEVTEREVLKTALEKQHPFLLKKIQKDEGVLNDVAKQIARLYGVSVETALAALSAFIKIPENEQEERELTSIENSMKIIKDQFEKLLNDSRRTKDDILYLLKELEGLKEKVIAKYIAERHEDALKRAFKDVLKGREPKIDGIVREVEDLFGVPHMKTKSIVLQALYYKRCWG